MDWRNNISFEPGKLGGKACIRGMRMSVADILDYLASGMSEDEILKESSYLKPDDIRACLAYAADPDRRRKLLAA